MNGFQLTTTIFEEDDDASHDTVVVIQLMFLRTSRVAAMAYYIAVLKSESQAYTHTHTEVHFVLSQRDRVLTSARCAQCDNLIRSYRCLPLMLKDISPL